jgi:hypothetical protein
MRLYAFACAMLAATGACLAQTIVDTEPNNTIATASLIVRTPGYFSGVGIGALNYAGDVDFYSIQVTNTELLTAAITPLMNGNTSPEIEAGIFDQSGDLLSLDTGSSGNGFQAIVSYAPTVSGTYYIGVTGSGDDQFIGDHTQQGPYQIVVGITPAAVPEPASLAGMGLGLVFLARKRINRKGAAR